jgi:hypothetical protein
MFLLLYLHPPASSAVAATDLSLKIYFDGAVCLIMYARYGMPDLPVPNWASRTTSDVFSGKVCQFWSVDAITTNLVLCHVCLE